jgi:hypothetical protein
MFIQLCVLLQFSLPEQVPSTFTLHKERKLGIVAFLIVTYSPVHPGSRLNVLLSPLLKKSGPLLTEHVDPVPAASPTRMLNPPSISVIIQNVTTGST